MDFKEYSEIVNSVKDGSFTSLKDQFDAICSAQDRLISELVSKGANLAGWKIVNSEGVIFVSPIFDFQIFNPKGESFSKEPLRGTELEVCFQLAVPKTELDISISKTQPFVAVELIRHKINEASHSACDLYFNYGILVSPHTILGEVNFSVSDQPYEFAFVADPVLIEEKREILKKGMEECVRRGYTDKSYFFMTGTLNGLVPVEDSIGPNQVVYQGESIVSFDIV